MLNGLAMPLPDLDTAPFWEACRRDELVVQQCGRCDRFRYPPGPMCPDCQSTESRWTRTAGTGTVYSWIVVRHAVAVEIADQVPYIVALVEIAQGARMITNLIECEPSEVTAGMRVRVDFSHYPSGMSLPVFRIEKEDEQ
jgi:uncharacterized protein